MPTGQNVPAGQITHSARLLTVRSSLPGSVSSEGPTFLKAMTNYTVRVGSDVTFTCQGENITRYKVSKNV